MSQVLHRFAKPTTIKRGRLFCLHTKSPCNHRSTHRGICHKIGGNNVGTVGIARHHHHPHHIVGAEMIELIAGVIIGGAAVGLIVHASHKYMRLHQRINDLETQVSALLKTQNKRLPQRIDNDLLDVAAVILRLEQQLDVELAAHQAAVHQAERARQFITSIRGQK
jgi:hypothetical protein